ncbi:MAG: ArsA-related P-loop ATPase [Nocardioidaceae bacterium]
MSKSSRSSDQLTRAGVRLHIVTGKGGTGKTTTAAALALTLATGGKSVLLCEVEGRQGIASAFDVAPLPYGERRIAVGPDGGEIFALAIEAEEALLEYLDMFYHLGRAGKALDRFGVVDFATTIAPGVRDVLLIGKVYEAARRSGRQEQAYDAVVLDAPPTGRIARFLNVNTEVAGIAKVGPIRNQATSIMRLLRSQQTRVHLVTTLEEMPVQETLDGIDALTDIELRPGAVILNMVRAPELTDDELAAVAQGRIDADRLSESLKESGVPVDDSIVSSLTLEARQHAARVALEKDQREQLETAALPMVSLPYRGDGLDLGDLYDFADLLATSGTF